MLAKNCLLEVKQTLFCMLLKVNGICFAFNVPRELNKGLLGIEHKWKQSEKINIGGNWSEVSNKFAFKVHPLTEMRFSWAAEMLSKDGQ